MQECKVKKLVHSADKPHKITGTAYNYQHSTLRAINAQSQEPKPQRTAAYSTTVEHGNQKAKACKGKTESRTWKEHQEQQGTVTAKCGRKFAYSAISQSSMANVSVEKRMPTLITLRLSV